MSQERWDVVLRFPSGPLSLQGDVVCRGPVVRLGANPGPEGGLRLDGYRGLDDRQATITAYDGGRAAIAPVGTNQVRLSTHSNVDWNEILPLRGPAYLTDGCAFHLGPPGRGVTVEFVECRRLGVWDERALVSEAAAVDQLHQPSEVKEIRASKVPSWFIPALLFVAGVLGVGLVGIYQATHQRKPMVTAFQIDGEEEVDAVVSAAAVLPPELKAGLNQPLHDFVWKPNAEAAGKPDRASPGDCSTAQKVDSKGCHWDVRFNDRVAATVLTYAPARGFWKRLDQVKGDYLEVVRILRDAKMPEVLAGIPWRESRYTPETPPNAVCAMGMWQFLPEVARRAKLRVENCQMAGGGLFTPQQDYPPVPVLEKAEYITRTGNQKLDKNGNPRGPEYSCRFRTCEVNEALNGSLASKGAVRLLKDEAWENPSVQASGAAVQLTISYHNSAFVVGRYEKWAKANPKQPSHTFLGANILCQDNYFGSTDKCGSVLNPETQHYAYHVVAAHILAVCYLAKNYSSMDPIFKEWKELYIDDEDGYCNDIDKLPSADDVRK